MTTANMKIRLINDETGWTDIYEVPECAEGYSGVPMSYWHETLGGFGQIVFKPSGERDAQGLLIFRTREQ